MATIRRGLGLGAAVMSLTAGLTLSTMEPAYAATVRGKSCGEKHAMSPDYYDAIGNAAPCTADFTTTGPTTARITIQVIPYRGMERRTSYPWSVDAYKCKGTVIAGDPPRTFECAVGPGRHTAFIGTAAATTKFTDLRVDF